MRCRYYCHWITRSLTDTRSLTQRGHEGALTWNTIYSYNCITYGLILEVTASHWGLLCSNYLWWYGQRQLWGVRCWCEQVCNVLGQNNFISFCGEVNLDIKCRLEFVLTPVFGCNLCVVCQQCEAYHSFSNWQIFTSQKKILKPPRDEKKSEFRMTDNSPHNLSSPRFCNL